MKEDQSMNLLLRIFRIVLQDCQTLNGKDLLTKEFQYIICNPMLEMIEGNKETEQLVARIVKKSEIDLEVSLADLRLTLALPTVKAILLYLVDLQKHSINILIYLEELNRQFQANDKEVKKGELDTENLKVIVKIANVEGWVPDNPSKDNTKITKFGFSSDITFLNKISEEGVIDRSIEAKVSSVSLIFAQESKEEAILKKFDIDVKYNEVINIERRIVLNVMPINIMLTFKQLNSFRLLADLIVKEILSIELAFLTKLKEEELVIEQKPKEDSKEMKLIVVAKIDLFKFRLEDDIAEYPYPLARLWVANLALDMSVDLEKGIGVSAHLFEIAVELGAMFDQKKENVELYTEYFKKLPWSSLETDITNLYKESM